MEMTLPCFKDTWVELTTLPWDWKSQIASSRHPISNFQDSPKTVFNELLRACRRGLYCRFQDFVALY